jgi:hypothetical protein
MGAVVSRIPARTMKIEKVKEHIGAVTNDV